ncbi:MAG TPA: CoA-binding protein [Syntrophales bacterium]|nr:CoA-binding protein [Syntrophales bacterium]
MVPSVQESPLFKIANPDSIAFFGASNNVSAMGTTQLNSLKSLGFEGTIYPVHPSETEVQGLKAYRSILDVPEVPDLAVMVVPTKIVCETMEACGEKGIRHAIVISGGFKESGTDGVEREQRLVAIAKRYGIRFIGPNCLGVTNPHHRLNTTFLRYESDPGYIGMASQSGSFVTQVFNYLSQYRLGFSTAFSVGNEADVDIVDCMQYLGSCPHTRVIALYVEGIRRGREFIETARSIIPEKPIVVYYVGGSETGKKAVFSHTGAMAGPDRLYDGVFRQSGVIRAESVTELFDFCWALGNLPEPGGRRVVIQTHSGGPGAEAADICGRIGLELPDFSDETISKLSAFVPHTGSIQNPVDITFSKNWMDFFSGIPRALLEEEHTDILLMYFLMPSEMVEQSMALMGMSQEKIDIESKKFIEICCNSLTGVVREYRKPVVGFTYRSFRDHFIQELLSSGVPVFPGPERAARAVRALVRYYEMRDEIMKTGGKENDDRRAAIDSANQGSFSF